MKSRILILATVAIIGLGASADILYWQVGDSAPDYATAYLSATDGSSTYYVSQNQFSGGGSGDAAVPANFANGGYAGGTISSASLLSWDDGETAFSGDTSALTFYIELFDSSNNWVAESPRMTVTQLEQLGQYVSSPSFNSNFTGANGTFGSGSTSYGVPEPTSGLLMLIGLGALALRRKRA